jgi:peroxiredoxin Q/BCP
MRLFRTALLIAAALCAVVVPLSAQAVDPDPIAVGTMAPDFELPGATRYGILADPVRLSDFRGDAVVLAFFFRARTRG